MAELNKAVEELDVYMVHCDKHNLGYFKGTGCPFCKEYVIKIKEGNSNIYFDEGSELTEDDFKKITEMLDNNKEKS